MGQQKWQVFQLVEQYENEGEKQNTVENNVDKNTKTKKNQKIENRKKITKQENTKKYTVENKVPKKSNQGHKHRGKGGKENKFTIMLSNLRGYRSKEYSLKKIF